MWTHVKFVIATLGMIVAIVANLGYHPSDEVHYHAGFTVYIDGVKQDYSEFKYMNLTPCGEHHNKKSAHEEQIEKAHLHDSVGDVVHVHRSGSKWEDLFKNIKVELKGNASGYINGKNIPNILEKDIEPNESVVIVVGKMPQELEYVSLDHIREVEQKSELCAD